MRKIKIAQIGTSKYSHGGAIFSTMAAHPEVFEIVGYALPENEREKFPKEMKKFVGYREMTVEEILGDPSIEAVAVETEEIYLTKYALMVARAGKHLHMEKPGGLSLKDFETLIATVSAKGTVFHTGYMYRYNPAIGDIIKRVKEGEIGEVISVEAHMSGWRDGEQTAWLGTFPGGMMFYLGCHLVDLVLQLQGMPARIIPFNKSTGVYDTDAKDYSMAVFEYKNGVSFIKTTQAEHGGFMRRQLVITGTKGKFEVRPLEVTIKYPLQYTAYTECMSEDWNDAGVSRRSPDHDRFTDMMLSFAAMVRGEKQNPYTYDYELALFKTVLKCCE
ncbi:MAG: Gfo/Idh/MocA family oxidoreductase [Clostridia bacterium]|nr:Gfo/Idh/MocA family oxidoreductase [Clostridia bacterium]